MNTMVKFSLCTLSDEELVKKVDKLTDEMFQKQEVPTRNIPAEPNNDYDLLVGELIVRFSNQVQAVVMPNEVIGGNIKLVFGEDTEKYSLWCEIVKDVFMEYDTTSEGEAAQILIDKIERLLKLVSQREA